MTNHVRIYEVGPRDGLQNEKAIIPTDRKIALIDLLSKAGFERIEATSFVSPKWVPQLADAAQVMAGITRRAGTGYAVLAPNLKGFERAVEAGSDEVAVFASASEAFSQKNINCSIAESLVRFEPVFEAAEQAGIPVRGYVSCVVVCPYSGAVAPQAVRDVARSLRDMGCYEISLGDTVGKGTPDSIARMLDTVAESVGADHLAGHFHDTDGNALANVEVALARGLRSFDSAIGGLGGCPYAPGAKGNVSTLPLVRLLEERGFSTGLDLDALEAAERYLSDLVAGLEMSKGTS
ncbi:hydroxymethylglutaryl-CoA lyase [Qingshengfaniella alkalisoli]|uniref:hydroxymethylglutaryl-CoA lyase n=1 Tax=Qingshengfaniella alkalisoli TaxID=2599296 RepID=A0A5B8J588_9RHOB|nr:hydroxymethylglutaryl-CoA lyase [Qingshengfaniella alkalisoli]QDY69480.1 hydroxymethylglutaryl-CoA lyase [Qingshengfaniella alkalisoli]